MDTVQKVEHLLQVSGEIDLGQFKSIFKSTFGAEYVCPKTTHSKCAKLITCLATHMNGKITIFGSCSNRKIRLKSKKESPSFISPTKMTTTEAIAKSLFAPVEFPSLSESVKQNNFRGLQSKDSRSLSQQIDVLLTKNGGRVTCSSFRSRYSDLFGKKFQCPSPKTCGLKNPAQCLERHFKGIISKDDKYVQKEINDSASIETIVAQGTTGVQEPTATVTQLNTTLADSSMNDRTASAQPERQGKDTIFAASGSYCRDSYQALDSVNIINGGKSAAFEFQLNFSPSGGKLTQDQINERVTYIRSRMSKDGRYIDAYALSRELCQFFRVRNVKELCCTDRRNGFNKETDIAAIKEFSMTQRKVLCMIQCYCTSATIATLHDLRQFICKVEGKTSFDELKLGPLQKFPLIFYFFKFPNELDIPKLSVSDVMRHLWQYCGNEGKGKRVELDKFLEYVMKKTGVESVFELGLVINSLPLAISVVKKTKFGDRERIKLAEEELIRNMEEDVNDYLNMIRKGLTGRNQRALRGQPENVMQKIAGLPIEECIMEIFLFVEDVKKKLRKNVSGVGLLSGATRVTESMIFFRRTPLLSKLFHVVVATGVYRKIGMDDLQLLELLGFKESIKKLAEERMVELFGDNKSVPASAVGRCSGRKLHVNQGKLLQQLRKWLQNKPKPLDIATLSMVEHKIVQNFNGSSFEGLGNGTFLEVIKNLPENDAVLGSFILLDSAAKMEKEDTESMKQDVMEFVSQCGREKQEGDIVIAIKRQFDFLRTWSSRHLQKMIQDCQNEMVSSERKVTFIHSLDCGIENSVFLNLQSNAGNTDQTGALGHFTKEDVITCLKTAPLLEDLARWSCWQLVFQPQFGELKTFLKEQDTVYALEIPGGFLLRISLDSTADDLKDAILCRNPQDAAGHLLSVICASGGLEEAPLIYLSNVIKSSIAINIEEAIDSCSPERFVLDCLLNIPVTFCSTIASQIFLNPLQELLGDDYGRDPVALRILRACVSNAERSFLHNLGALLSVEEWKKDFRERRFGQSKQTSKDQIYLKKRLTEDDQQKKTEKQKSQAAAIAIEMSNKTDFDNKMEPDAANIPNNEFAEADSDKGEDLSEAYEDIDEEGTATLLGQLEGRKLHCKGLIDEIRLKEFGIGEKLDEKGEVLLQKNNDRLCRSLDRLSKELYAKDTHFVLELIQNADDNNYDAELMCDNSEEKPSVAFVVDRENVVVLNNEQGFEDVNVKAICDVGKSTKGAHRKGYIGQKGIGFKSVFRITDCPEIHSNGFHICFDASKDRMGYICPQWCEDNFKDLRDFSPIQHDVLVNWKTQINLPLKKDVMNSEKASSRFQNIHPSLLLFLNRLQTVIIENKIDNKCLVMKKRIRGKNLVELSQNGIPSTWFILTKEIEINMKGECATTDVSLSFPLECISDLNMTTQALPSQNVFAFLPLRSYGFKFLIQADFEVPSSREDIDRDSAWNQAILKEIPRLLIEAFFKFRDHSPEECLPDALYSASRFFQYLPLESEILGVFRPVARKIIQLLQKEDCIPVVKEDLSDTGNKDSDNPEMIDWTKPSQAILGDSMLQKLVSPADLRRYLNLSYTSEVMQKTINPTLLKTLGVQSVTLDCLLEICKSHLKVISQEKGKCLETFQWIGRWLLCVAHFLEQQYDTSQATLQRIKSVSVFPLCNGDLVNLEGDAVFFPFQTHTKSKQDRNIRQLEDDLNTIDGRIFSDLDQISKLKLERFLSDLGVRTFSAKDVIQKHIIPAFASGKWKTKEHLVVPYLIYIKEQCQIDENAVDFEELRKVLVVETNQGIVQPSMQQIYFTQYYGNQLDLKERFPAVKWHLLSARYLMEKKDNGKSWQKFFKKFGITDFPKMKKNSVTVHVKELADSPWGNVKETWPSTSDGIYQIVDMVCSELEIILDSEDTMQLFDLAQILDKRWSTHFAHYQNVTVKDSKGNEIANSMSSFIIKLKTLPWLPGKTPEHGDEINLFKPKDLYLQEVEIKAVFGDFCPYFIGKMDDVTFINAIEIKNVIKLDQVFQCLSVWSSDEFFSTTVEHMIRVYNYIKDRIKDVDTADLDKQIIFVPSHPCKPTEKTRGRFYRRGEVCLYDFSKVMIKRSDLLPQKRQLLFHYYPKDVLLFFESEMKIDKTPTIRDYVNMACALSENTRLPDRESFQDLMAVFSQLGQKCIAENSEEDFQDLVKSSDSIWERFAIAGDLSDERRANFMFQNLKDEKVFPTHRDRFVSCKEKPLLVDNKSLEQIFEKEETVHFLAVPDLKKMMERKHTFASKEEKHKMREEKLLGAGILTFFAICKVKTISQVVSPPSVFPENSVDGCYEWHNILSQLLPYMQRFLYKNDRVVYNDLLKDGISEKLENLRFFTANSITAVHTISGRDEVNVQLNRKCAVEHIENKIYVYVGRNFLNEKEDILGEFLKLFAKENESLAERLLDMLTILEGMIKGNDKKERIEKFLKRKDIPLLPDEEKLWNLKEIVKPKASNTSTKISVDQVKEQISTGEITCWPPKAPDFTSSLPKEIKSETTSLQTKWPFPAPPEAMDVSRPRIPVNESDSKIKPGTIKRASREEKSNMIDLAVVSEQSPKKLQAVSEECVDIKEKKTAKGNAMLEVEIQKRSPSNTSSDNAHNAGPNTKMEIPMSEMKQDGSVSEKVNICVKDQEKIPAGKVKDASKSKEEISVGTVNKVTIGAGSEEHNKILQQNNSLPIQSLYLQVPNESKGVIHVNRDGNQLQSLNCAYEEVDIENIASEITEVLTNPEDETASNVGWLGEKLVHLHLLKEFGEQIKMGFLKINWMNQNEESYAPFDIALTNSNGHAVRLIEVKSTTVEEDKPFEISSNELKLAFHEDAIYDVYRVTGVGKSSSPRIKVIRGLVKYLQSGAVKIFVVL